MRAVVPSCIKLDRDKLCLGGLNIHIYHMYSSTAVLLYICTKYVRAVHDVAVLVVGCGSGNSLGANGVAGRKCPAGIAGGALWPLAARLCCSATVNRVDVNLQQQKKYLTNHIYIRYGPMYI